MPKITSLTLQQSPSQVVRKVSPNSIFKREQPTLEKSLTIFNAGGAGQGYVQTNEIKRVFEEWEKSPHLSIEKQGPASPFDLSQNVNYRNKVVKLKDFQLAAPLYDEKTYFKSISSFVRKEKTPIAETQRSFESSLCRDSLDCIPETSSFLSPITSAKGMPKIFTTRNSGVEASMLSNRISPTKTMNSFASFLAQSKRRSTHVLSSPRGSSVALGDKKG